MSHIYQIEGNSASNKIYISESGDRYFLPDSWEGGVFQTFRLSAQDWQFAKTFDIVATSFPDPNFSMIIQQLSDHCKIVVDFLDTNQQWKGKRFKHSLPKRTEIAREQANQRLILDLNDFSCKTAITNITREMMERIENG